MKRGEKWEGGNKPESVTSQNEIVASLREGSSFWDAERDVGDKWRAPEAVGREGDSNRWISVLQAVPHMQCWVQLLPNSAPNMSGRKERSYLL